MEGLTSADGPLMDFDLGREPDGTTVVTVRGDLDIASADRLNAAVAPMLEADGRRLIVDVQALRFADSSAIALWVRWAATVEELQLRGASPLLRRLINAMGLEQHLRLST
jgi:anti-sigma B factor antagonist/stage II sporulation protein AA (anti-sigma F factor antagonist)